MTPLWRVGVFVRERQRWVLFSLMAVLHLTLLAGSNTTLGLMLWFVDLGLFILWQPFIQTERKLDTGSLLLFTAVLAAGAWLFGWWLMILWVLVLAALLGGRVLLLGHLPTRLFYLLAFAYLLCALLMWLLPRVVPHADTGVSLDQAFAWTAPLIFIGMLVPRPREIRLVSGGIVDFFYSLFVLLLVSVLVLGSLAFMLLRQASYVEAVFKTAVSMAVMLFLVAWAWNPRPGFSGIGVFLSRYVLGVALPFETWLQGLLECADNENDPDRFLEAAARRIADLAWATGAAWAPASGATVGAGRVGEESRFRSDFPAQTLVLTLFTPYKLSPSLVWHVNLLVRLTGEYYVAKHRARELQQMTYLSAIHETGARLTHDVKNLLQSLNNLCFVAQEASEADAPRLHQLFQRQLPQIAHRLERTLANLQAPRRPEDDASGAMPVQAWWEGLRQRYAYDGVRFEPVVFDPDMAVPALLFDSVADNLLQNALLKRQTEDRVEVVVSLSKDATRFRVIDSGTAIDKAIEADLLRAPVPSEEGFGIGLYNAARQAESYGYRLALTNNINGRVCFELTRM